MFVQVTRIELTSEHWQCPVITIIRYLLLWTRWESNPPHLPCKGKSPKPWNMLAHYICAGNQNRTDITDLEGRCNNHYTIPAFVGKVGFEPTFSTSRYVYRMYKIPTVLAEIKKPSLFETGLNKYVESKSYIT